MMDATPATRGAAAIEGLWMDLLGAGRRDNAGARLPPVLAALIGAGGCGCLARASRETP